MELRVAVEPPPTDDATLINGGDDRFEFLKKQVVEAGGHLVDELSEANSLVWLDVRGAGGLSKVLDANPHISWVQLPWAGVEDFAETGVFHRGVEFTCTKAAFGPQVG